MLVALRTIAILCGMDIEHDSQGPCCNLEFKARLSSLATAHQRAQELSTRVPLREFQVDTYFHSLQGRLKLREIDQCRGQLIWYQRADQAAARESHYHLIEITDVAAISQLLSAALGIRCRVEKQRTIYWFENVRIHVDEVGVLGDFIEFEAVITTAVERAAAAGQLEFLSAALKINATDVLTMSYGDMMESPGDLQQSVAGVGSADK